MEVEHRLPGGGAAGVQEVDAVGAQPLAEPPRQPLGGVERGGQVLGGDVEQIGAVLTRDHERMAAGRGRDVHERDRALVFVDDPGGQLARDDLAEDAVRVSHQGGEDSLSASSSRAYATASLRLVMSPA